MSDFSTTAEPGGRKVAFRRSFDAPRDVVYRAMTEPESVPRWWGPKEYTVRVEKADVRPGGEWRLIQRGPDGTEHAFYGVYREVVPGERLKYTFIYDEAPQSESVETVTFTERDGRTIVTDEVEFPTAKERDEALRTGMEAGAIESMERLDELVTKSRGHRFGTRNE